MILKNCHAGISTSFLTAPLRIDSGCGLSLTGVAIEDSPSFSGIMIRLIMLGARCRDKEGRVVVGLRGVGVDIVEYSISITSGASAASIFSSSFVSSSSGSPEDNELSVSLRSKRLTTSTLALKCSSRQSSKRTALPSTGAGIATSSSRSLINLWSSLSPPPS